LRSKEFDLSGLNDLAITELSFQKKNMDINQFFTDLSFSSANLLATDHQNEIFCSTSSNHRLLFALECSLLNWHLLSANQNG